MKRDRMGRFVQTWDGEHKRAVKLSLTTTAWQILEQQSQAQGISRSELVEAYARHLQSHSTNFELGINQQPVGLQPTDQTVQQPNTDSLQSFKTLAENTSDLVSRIDAEMRYLYVNPALQQAMETAAADMIGKTNAEIGMSPKLCPQWQKGWQQVFTTGQEYSFDFKLTTSLGDRWYRARLIPELGASGAVESILNIAHKLNPERNLEQTLQQTEERLQIALTAANAIVWDMDLQSNWVVYSSNAINIFGFQEGTVDAFFASIHPEDRPKATQALDWAIAGDKYYSQEYRVVRSDGMTRWFSSRGQIYLDANQENPIRMVGISIDITERKSTENALRQSKERLRAANERFRLAAMAVNCLIYDWDVEQDYVERTESLTQILGYTFNEVEPTGNWWRKLVHPDDLSKVIQQAQIALAKGDQCKAEYRILNKKNEYIYVLDQCLVVSRDANGVPLRIVGSTTDITNRKRTEAALARSNQTLQAIIQACPLAIMGLRSDGTVRIWNPAAERIFGWSKQEVLGQFLPAIPLAKRDEFLKNLAATMQGQGLIGVETQRLRQDGKLIDVQLWSACVNEAEAGISCLSVVADISDRKRTEAALRESEERLRMALDAGQAGVWDWNILTNQITWSERIYQFHGLTPETFGGTIEEYSKLIHPDDRDELFARVEQALQNQTPYQIEFRALHPDGTIKWLSTSGQGFFRNGEAIRMLGATLDITARKYAEAEREDLLKREREARESAETANRIKDEFLAVLSHELRSPLNPILGWTKLLRTRSFDQQATDRALETIERNAKLQAQLIEDLLDVSRILQGKLRLNVSPVNLVTTIESALETVELSAEAKAIDLRFEVSGNIKVWTRETPTEWRDEKISQISLSPALTSSTHQPIQVMGDPGRLQQIIWNLLSNAIKFTPNGGRVEVKLESFEFSALNPQLEKSTPHSQPASQHLQNYAQITVTDTGQGISSDFLPHVFEYFRQADSSTTRQFGGLGLGLAIVHHLVELHGGVVQVESPGKGLGATFVVKLPLRKTNNVRLLRQEEPSSSIDLSLQQPLANLQILVVDDDADMRDLVAFILSEQGAIAQVAASAAEALELFDQSIPDVLISDIGMPQMDGYTLLQQVRQRTPNQGGNVPAIALTAYAGELNQKRALAAGFQLHITKPIEPAELIKTITTLLTEKVSQEEPKRPLQ